MSSSQREPAAILHHARRRIALIRAWTANDTLATYLANEERQHAVERAFIGIGEAIKDLARAVDLKALDPDGPWREAPRFRVCCRREETTERGQSDLFTPPPFPDTP